MGLWGSENVASDDLTESQVSNLTGGEETDLHKHRISDINVVGFITTISETITVLDDTVAIGISGCQLATNARIIIGQRACLRLI